MFSAKELTDEQKIRALREDIVTMRVECPKIIQRLMENEMQHKMQNMVRFS